MLATSRSEILPSCAPVSGSKTGSRLVYLDSLRGLLLVIMAVNHVPSELHAATDHPFGYMSAAEGFVFLSGLVAGLVYTRRYLRDGLEALHEGCVNRAKQIYLYHLAVYFSIYGLMMLFTRFLGHPLPNAPLQMIVHPWRALVAGPMLLSQPSLLDILPFYCAYMLLCPYLVKAYENGKRVQVLGISFVTWLAVNIFSPQQPLLHTATFNSGAFNIFAWQLLFVAGTAFGHAWARKQNLLPKPSRAAIAAMLCLAGFLLAVRHAWIEPPMPSTTLSWLTNKNNLAPLRLLNTAIIFWIVHAFVKRFPRFFTWNAFAFLGRESLAVFTVHVLVAYVLLAFPQVFDQSAASRTLGIALLLASMFSTAAVARMNKQPSAPTGERNPPTPASPEPAFLFNLCNGKRTIGPADPLHHRSG